eukprot:13835005-Heterocapsa_arctica.AAC.1
MMRDVYGGLLFTALLSLNCKQLPNAPPDTQRAASRHIGDASAACAACCYLRDLLPLTRPASTNSVTHAASTASRCTV